MKKTYLDGHTVFVHDYNEIFQRAEHEDEKTLEDVIKEYCCLECQCKARFENKFQNAGGKNES
jgi:hypothetical protein